MTMSIDEKKSGSVLLNPASASDTSKGRILVVDDEEQLRQLFRTVLSLAGYTVLEADDGKLAMDCVEREPLDLIITDLVMPERDGIEIIRGIHSKHPQLKIIAISGAFDGNFLKVAKAMGAYAVLMKPISIENLLSVVRRALEQPADESAPPESTFG
jgi:DNA-binding NtrC family response regulator